MSLPRKIVKERDAEYMRQARVQGRDTTAERFTKGNVYSRADIELLEWEKLKFWRRRRR